MADFEDIRVGWALPTKAILQSETKWWAVPTLQSENSYLTTYSQCIIILTMTIGL